MINEVYKTLVNEMDDSILNELVIKGETKSDITNRIVEYFYDLFENKENLKNYADDFLVQDYINFHRSSNDQLHDKVKQFTNIYNKSKEKNCEQIMEGFALFQDYAVEVGNKHWSMCILERDYSQLGTYEYVTECFGMIENVCEVYLKHFLALVLYTIKVLKGKHVRIADILKYKLGNIVNELSQREDLHGIMYCNGISISQWRNTAAHRSYRIESGKIICNYGQDNENEFIINQKEDLLNVFRELYSLAQTLNFSNKFFVYDNVNTMASYQTTSSNSFRDRDENWHLIYVTDLNTHGYQVREIIDNESVLTIAIHDFRVENIKNQEEEILRFIYKAWSLTQRNIINIIIENQDGIKLSKTSINLQNCHLKQNINLDHNYLSKHVWIRTYT